MSYVSQARVNQVDHGGKNEDNRCGAFCIAYWKCLSDGDAIPEAACENDTPEDNIPKKYTPEEEKFLDVVEKNYKKVMFHKDSISKDLKDFLGDNIEGSNPCAMVAEIRKLNHGKNATFKTSEHKIEEVYNMLCGESTDYPHAVKESPLPELEEGKYAILLLGKNQDIPQHYVLAKGVKDGEKNRMIVINPGHGETTTEADKKDGITVEYGMNNDFTINGLIYMKAAIYIE